MAQRKANQFKWQMTELPTGITTSNGNWYNITTEQIEEYVPGLLKKHPLKTIIRQADEWITSSNSLSLILYFVLVLLNIDATVSMLVSILFFLFWHFKGSAFASPALGSVFKVINQDGFLYVGSLAVLVYMAFQEQFLALWLGIILFFLFKVGLLQLLIRMIETQKQSNKPEPHDRVLNMLLIRYGIKEGLMPQKIQKMQDNLIEVATYHKTRDKKKNKSSKKKK